MADSMADSMTDSITDSIPRTRYLRWAMALAVLCVTEGASAESPRYFELEGFGHFLDGNPETTAVTEEGAIALPPGARDRFADPAAAFSAAAARGDTVVVARVDDSQVSELDKNGQLRPLFKADEAMVTAILAQDGDLYVAAGPPAKIYRVDSKGKSSVFYAPEANYVWGMAAGPGGSIYCVTGEPGTVVKIDRKGTAKVVFKPEQTHLRSIAYDATLGLFVGGGERGVLYRAKRDDEFRALYDTGNPEVTAIALHEPYAFVAGVTGAANLAGGDDGTASKHPAKGGATDVHSQLMRIAMDGTSEVLAGSSDEAVFALALDEHGQVIVATGATGRDDPRGRLYSIDPEKRVISMIYQSPSRRVTHLVKLQGGAIAAVAAGGGRITEITRDVAKKGEFFTLPYDTGINSHFGLVQVLGSYPKGTKVLVAVRTGQTTDPDGTWTGWSDSIEAPGGKSVEVANGRYLQVRLTLESSGDATPLVQRLRVAYLRQNLPPFVREVAALHKGITLLPLPREDNKSKTVSLVDKPDDHHGDDDHRAQPRARQIQERGALTIKWVADDPNGDELRFDLMMRNVGDPSWRLLKDGMEDPFYSMKSSQLPDGYYQFKVRATDARANPDGLERTDTRESRAVLVDNTPPEVAPLKVTVSGHKATARTSVKDAVGPLMEATYALDGGEPHPILPDDGLLDGPREDLTIRLPELTPGRHVLTVRAADEADNEGFGEATFEIR